LSYFGMVPAALSGMDLAQMLARAEKMAGECGPDIPPDKNPAARLGAILGDMAKYGRDKLTFILSKEIAPFGDWVEQLIAESTGKEGTGILPVVGEPIGSPEIYGNDRLFVHMDLTSSKSGDADRIALSALETAGHPVLRFLLSDTYDLGGQFFLWELATAVAGYRLGINPFDQPNVESAKVKAREMVKAYKEKGALPAQTPSVSKDGVQVFGRVNAASPGEALVQFLGQAKDGDYIALQAFVPPTDDNFESLQELRLKLRYRTHLATTSGFGPRFLHSTGQLHKGDGGHGLFIQFTSNSDMDLPIPDEAGGSDSSIGFGVLKLAQAMGDLQALQDVHRRAIRFHIEADLAKELRSLARAVETG
jgi:transaldolase/glucose-6-phosphate isomerase